MSQMTAFIEKAKSDGELMEKLNALGKKNAGPDEVIALAAEYGFTVTKEEIESARRQSCPHHGKLTEEDLDAVSGGWTQNRYDPAVCKPELGRTRYECLGFLCWCDHLRVENDVGTIGGGTKLSRYICDMGAFNYIGGNAGQPV